MPRAVNELIGDRSARESVWHLSNGGTQVRSYLTPHYFHTAGGWQPIDTHLIARSASPGWLATTASDEPIALGPLGASGGSAMIRSRLTGRTSAAITFAPANARVGVRPTVSPTNSSEAIYTGVWASVNVEDTALTDGLREDLILAKRSAPTSFSFAVSGATLRVVGVDVALMVGSKRVGTIPFPSVSLARPVRGISTSLANPRLTVSRSTLTISVSPTWLSHLPTAAFPVTIDPSFYDYDNFQYASAAEAIRSDGVSSATLNVGRDSGGREWRTAIYIPAIANLPTLPTGSSAWKLITAQLTISCTQLSCSSLSPNGNDTKHWTAYNDGPNVAAPPTFSAITAGQQLPNSQSNPPDTCEVANGGYGPPCPQLADYLQPGATGVWVGLTAQGATNDYGTIDTSFTDVIMDYLAAPPATQVTSPSNTAIVSTATPILTAKITDNTDYSNGNLYFDFTLSTGTGGTNAVADSGWLSTNSWTVPSGSLHDGVTYYATVETDVGEPWTNGVNYYDFTNPYYPYVAPQPHGAEIDFTVKLRLGDGGPSPTDTVGTPLAQTQTPSHGAPGPGTAPSSETVNMVTGNLALSVNAGADRALAGTAGVQLSYNSSASSFSTGGNYGLLGHYYTNDGTNIFPANPIAQRTDPGVNLSWQPPDVPIAAYPRNSTRYLMEWTGLVRLPAGASWSFGGRYDGGMRIYLDGSSTPVFDSWYYGGCAGPNPTFGTSQVPGGVNPHAIRVDFWYDNTCDHGQQTSVQLWVHNESDSVAGDQINFLVPPNWTAPTNTGLPPGWTMSSADLRWSRAEDQQSQVVLSSPSGDTATFVKTTAGVYQGPPGDTDFLTVDGDGHLQLSTSGGQLYTFNGDGTIAAVTTAGDDRHPAALQYSYSGNPATLTAITDPVSQRSVTLSYGGSAPCPLANNAPAGELCHVAYWDGTAADFSYNGNGQLAQVTGPGGATTLLAYNSDGRVNEIRDALAYDYIASNPSNLPGGCRGNVPSTCALDTQITYDSSERVSAVTQPSPTIGASRPQRTYHYFTNTDGSGTTTVAIAGFTPSRGFAEETVYDSQSRITQKISSSGLATESAWDSAGNSIAVVGEDGEQTSRTYDAKGDVMDTYGPAPAACFTGALPPGSSIPVAPMVGYLPAGDPVSTVGCGVVVPHATTTYDDGMSGLAATFFPNGNLAGAAQLHTTGVSTGWGGSFCTSGTLCAQWPAGSAPVSTDASNHWGLRLTGLLTISRGGTHSFTLRSSQASNLSIDGTAIASNGPSNPDFHAGQPNDVSGTSKLASGVHTIELDISPNNNQVSEFVALDDPPGTQTAAPIAVTSLDPNYGLETTVTDADGLVTQTRYSDNGVDPVYGLVTAQVRDPGGLALSTTTTYESPGPNAYLRRTSTTLPAGNTTTYQYYAGTDGPVATACTVPAGTPQGGQLQSEIDPPAVPGAPAREQQFIYDASGRQTGVRVGTTASIGSAGWRCTRYDARGRIVKQTWPPHGSAAARTVTYSYSIGGNPLVSSVSDTALASGGITSTVDLLGRLATYTDAAGFTSTIIYNQAGQITQTSGPQGSVVNTYDPDSGRLGSVQLAGSTLASTQYDAGTGRLTGVTYGNHTSAALGYDAYGHQTGLTITNVSTEALLAGDQVTYTPGSRMSSESVDVNGSMTALSPSGGPAYTYDRAGRLISAWQQGGQGVYSYGVNSASDNCPLDSAGANTNRASVVWSPTTGSPSETDYCYNYADQMTASITGAGTSSPVTINSYAYDDHGNETQDGNVTITYDAADRVASAGTSSSTTSYQRDPVDRLLGVSTTNAHGTTTATYSYSGYQDSPVAVVTGSTVLQQIIALPGSIQAVIQPAGGQVWAYPDLHGNFTTTVNGSGSILHTATYDPWGSSSGAARLNDLAGPAYQGAFGASGRLTDPASGLTALGARGFNASEARFLSTDPVDGGCANLYTYAFGDPVNTQDTTGRSTVQAGGGACGSPPPSAHHHSEWWNPFSWSGTSIFAKIGATVAMVGVLFAAGGAILIAGLGGLAFLATGEGVFETASYIAILVGSAAAVGGVVTYAVFQPGRSGSCGG